MKNIKILISVALAAAMLSACNNTTTGKIQKQTTPSVTPSVSGTQGSNGTQVSPTTGAGSTTNKGGTTANAGTGATATPTGSTGQSIIKNNANYTVLSSSDIPDAIASDIKALSNKRGYYYRNYNGSYYIGIFSGEKPTGGYLTEISSLQDKDGKTSILVKETKPSKSDTVSQSVTYPYIIVKTSQVSANFEVKTTDGETLEQLHVLR